MKTIEEKAKAYDEALKAAIAAHKDEDRHLKATLERIFPELQESEDERIRKGLIKALSSIGKRNWGGIDVFESIAWLEKQKSVGEIVERCKNSWYNEGKIAGMTEGLTNDEKYQQGWHDALEKQGEQKATWSEEDEEMIDKIIDYMKPMPIFFESTKGKSGKEYTKEFIKNAIKWLKSIKGRIQPQQKWIEEDENGFGETLWAINKARTIAENENDMGNLWYAENWLKSLKERLS